MSWYSFTVLILGMLGPTVLGLLAPAPLDALLISWAIIWGLLHLAHHFWTRRTTAEQASYYLLGGLISREKGE